MIRYSRRLPWSAPPNFLVEAQKRKQTSASPVLDLTVSNPTTALAGYGHAKISEAFRSLSDWTYRPEPLGLRSAREFVSQHYAERALHVDSSRIALTASTSEAYGFLFKLLCDPGAEVLVPAPSYPLFDYLAAAESVTGVPYRLRYDGSWHIDWADLQRRTTSRTRALVIVNPNNPTGSYLKTGERSMLVEFVSQNGLALIADEVFSDYEFGIGVPERVRTLAGTDEILSFSLNGLSKVAGMPQMKLGWIVVNGPEELRSEALAKLELILDTYLSANLPVQAALGDLLAVGGEIRCQLQTRCEQNLVTAASVVAGSPVTLLHAEGGWSAILHLPALRSEEEWTLDLLERQNVLVQPGFFFDMEGGPFVVVSLITEESVFKEGLNRLVNLAEWQIASG